VLEGTLRYTVDGVTRDLGPGDSMGTPRGSVHAFANPHDGVARALVINTPDIGAAYFREIGAIVNAGGPPDKAKMLATMQRYGLLPAQTRAQAAAPGGVGGLPDPSAPRATAAAACAGSPRGRRSA